MTPIRRWLTKFSAAFAPFRKPDAPEETDWEAQFVREYRESALIWAKHACIAGALIFLCFLVVALTLEPLSPVRIAVRVLMVGLLLSVAGYFHFFRDAARERYVPVAGLTSLAVLLITVGLSAREDRELGESIVRASPAVVFGLFVHYSFLKLPVSAAAGVGWTTAIAAGMWSPMVIGGSALVRSVIYLGAANLLGMVISRFLEFRERELFLQRRIAETARADARERAKAAEEADRQKTRLIAAISHDLRQPMTAAVAHLDVLRRRIDRDDVPGAREQAAKAEAAVGILGATLDHLLTAARYDSRTEPIAIHAIELAPMLRSLRDSYLPDSEARGIVLRLRLPSRRILVSTHPPSLYRVLGNLVSNAIKFTDRCDGRVSGVVLGVVVHGGWCRINVVDTGKGIPSEHLGSIWEPYVQLHNSERIRDRGLGLGLFLVRRIIEQLPDHSIDVRSVYGRGSRFSVRLPGVALAPSAVLATDKASELEDPMSSIGWSSLIGAYVLLIEDDRDARLSLQELLDEWGVLYLSGASLAEILEGDEDSERLVDAIICDYRLPGGTNGVECVEQIRARLGYAPGAVLITGEPEPDTVRARVGPDTVVLHKPFAPSALALPLVEAVRAARIAERQ